MRIGDWSSDVCSSDLKSRKAVVDRHVPVKERGQILREIACTRWLTNEELVDILTNHEEFEFPLAKEAPRNPRSAFDVSTFWMFSLIEIAVLFCFVGQVGACTCSIVRKQRS